MTYCIDCKYTDCRMRGEGGCLDPITGHLWHPEPEEELLEIKEAASALVEAVERYVCPKKGEFCHRNELLTKCRNLKELL